MRESAREAVLARYPGAYVEQFTDDSWAVLQYSPALVTICDGPSDRARFDLLGEFSTDESAAWASAAKRLRG
jgi:hypothetical protein